MEILILNGNLGLCSREPVPATLFSTQEQTSKFGREACLNWHRWSGGGRRKSALTKRYLPLIFKGVEPFWKQEHKRSNLKKPQSPGMHHWWPSNCKNFGRKKVVNKYPFSKTAGGIGNHAWEIGGLKPVKLRPPGAYIFGTGAAQSRQTR